MQLRICERVFWPDLSKTRGKKVKMARKLLTTDKGELACPTKIEQDFLTQIFVKSLKSPTRLYEISNDRILCSDWHFDKLGCKMGISDRLLINVII